MVPEEVGKRVGAEPGIEHEGNVSSGVIYRAGGHHENWGIANTKVKWPRRLAAIVLYYSISILASISRQQHSTDHRVFRFLIRPCRPIGVYIMISVIYTKNSHGRTVVCHRVVGYIVRRGVVRGIASDV